MNNEATAYLRSDHQRILALLDTLEAPLAQGASAVEDRRARAVELVIAETRHQSVEEELFWPMVRAVLNDGDHVADRALSHHAEGKRLLTTVENAEAGSAEFETALASFISAARTHIMFEEQEVWPQFCTAIDVEQSQHLSELIEGFNR